VFNHTRVHPSLSVGSINLAQWHVAPNTHPLSVDSSGCVFLANEAALLLATCLFIRIILCIVPTSIFSNDTSQSPAVHIRRSCYSLAGAVALPIVLEPSISQRSPNQICHGLENSSLVFPICSQSFSIDRPTFALLQFVLFFILGAFFSGGVFLLTFL